MPTDAPKAPKRRGRPKGRSDLCATTDKAYLAHLARQHAEKAIERLVYLAEHAESEAASVSACKELLDRGYGKPHQSVENHVSNGVEIRDKPKWEFERWLVEVLGEDGVTDFEGRKAATMASGSDAPISAGPGNAGQECRRTPRRPRAMP